MDRQDAGLEMFLCSFAMRARDHFKRSPGSYLYWDVAYEVNEPQEPNVELMLAKCDYDRDDDPTYLAVRITDDGSQVMIIRRDPNTQFMIFHNVPTLVPKNG